MALTNPSTVGSVKSAIVADLLQRNATSATKELLEYAVSHMHGRRLDLRRQSEPPKRVVTGGAVSWDLSFSLMI